MRIACLQFAPQVGDVNNNLNRADAVLNKANPEDIDLLVLPELAFTGYNFRSLQHISPFLEPSGSGISSLWARTTALKYDCVVAVGYPEKVDVAEKWPTSPEYYNSAILVNGDGETIVNYRKSFLFTTDETWALEGEGFYEGHIPGLGHTAVGICMDINPYRFEAPWHSFEFAFHILEYEANLVILSMSWLTREDQRIFTRMPKEPDMETLTYWISRLEPVIRSENEEEIIVVFCNRTGTEDEVLYAGTSAVLGIKQGEVNVYGILGRGDKELLVVDTDNAPFAQLVYRPDEEQQVMTSDLRNFHMNDQDTARLEQANAAESASSARPRKPTPNPERQRTSREPAGHRSTGHRNAQKSPSRSPSEKSSRSITSTKSVASTKSMTSTKSVASSKSRASSRSAASRSGGHSRKRSGSSKPLPRAQAQPQQSQSRSQPQQSSLPKLNTGSRAETLKSPRKERPSPKITIPVTDPYGGGNDIPTPTAPSPTPIDLRPNFDVPSTSHTRRRGVNRDDTPHPATGPVRDPWQLYSSHTAKRSNPYDAVTPFPDVDSPASPRYFWVPSDTLLKTPAVAEHPRERSSSRTKRQQPSNHVETPLTAIHVHSGSNIGMSRRANVPKRPTPVPDEVRNTNPSRSATHKPRQSSRSQLPERGGDSLLDRPNPPYEERPLPPRPSSPKSRQASRQRGGERTGSSMGSRVDSVPVKHTLEMASQVPSSTTVAQRSGSAMATQRSGSAMGMQRPGSAMAGQRSGSAMGNQRPGSALANQRPGSAMDGRQSCPPYSSTPARPSSPKSRNASRSRREIDPAVDQRLTNLSRSSILIAASPSIYDASGGGRPRSASFQQEALEAIRARVGSRNGQLPHRSSSALGQHELAQDRSDSVLMPVTYVDPNDRTVSRGRQRVARYIPKERSHSANSTWPEVPRSRFPSPDPGDVADEIIAVEGTVSPNCPVHGAHHQPGEHTFDEIVAIEGTVSENCPVHGSHSRPPNDRRRTNSSARGNASGQARHESSQRHGTRRRESARSRQSDRREAAQRHPSELPRDLSHRTSPPQSHCIAQNKDSPMYSNSVETLATPAGSPATPQQEPTTPKAMVLLAEKILIPVPSYSKDLAGPIHPIPGMHAQLVCRDREDTKVRLHRPRSAVW